MLPSMTSLLLHLLTGRKSIYSLICGCSKPSMESQFLRNDRVAVADRCVKKRGDESLVRGGDAEVVLRSLNMFNQRVDDDELFGLLDVENPRLEEVKEAFDVFDENRDGFIDAEELQKVMCALGFREGLEVEECKRMIVVIDENGDGRVDFDEFVKLMESSFV